MRGYEEGNSGTIEANINEGVKRDETDNASRGKKSMEQTKAANMETEVAEDGTDMTMEEQATAT